MTSIAACTISNVLRNERPERDGTRWSDGARDEWETTRINLRRALISAGMSDSETEEFDAACFA